MRVLIAIFAAALAFAPLAATAQEAEPDYNFATFKGDDPVLAKARTDAIKSLPQFWLRYDADPVVRETAVVKAEFKSSDGKTEAMWVLIESRKDGVVTGLLANIPVYDVGVRQGDTVTLKEKDLIDWGYRRDGVRWGYFTGRAQYARLPADKKAEAYADANFSTTPIEP